MSKLFDVFFATTFPIIIAMLPIRNTQKYKVSGVRDVGDQLIIAYGIFTCTV